jgi:sarcosine oxidase subunit beta
LTTSDVIIIGGGISGTAAAYHLAREGVRVTLVERGALGSMASGWTLAGVRQSGRHAAELPLAQAAVRRWEGLAEELEADVEYRQEGNLRLALSTAETATIRQVVADGTAAGIAMTYLPDNAALREVAPALAEDIVAASFCPTDGHANPDLTVRAFAAAAVRFGAAIRPHSHVDRILVDGDRVTGVALEDETLSAETVIVAAGVYTPRLLGPLGLDLPLKITHVPAVQSVPLPPILAQVLGVAAAGFAGRQQADGRFRLTGGSIAWSTDENHSHHTAESVLPQAAQVQDTIAQATRLVPALRTARIARVWGGLIDQTPDAIPVIERSPAVDGLVIAAGFSGHGFCLGPATGQVLAELATGQSPSLPIAPFRLARFAGDVTQAAAHLHG